MQTEFICDSCVHWKNGDKCKAFDKIPSSIIIGKNDHSKPLKGQKNDLVYKRIED